MAKLVRYCAEPRGSEALQNSHARMADGIVGHATFAREAEERPVGLLVCMRPGPVHGMGRPRAGLVGASWISPDLGLGAVGFAWPSLGWKWA